MTASSDQPVVFISKRSQERRWSTDEVLSASGWSFYFFYTSLEDTVLTSARPQRVQTQLAQPLTVTFGVQKECFSAQFAKSIDSRENEVSGIKWWINVCVCVCGISACVPTIQAIGTHQSLPLTGLQKNNGQ